MMKSADMDALFRASAAAWVEDADQTSAKLDSAAWAAELTGRVNAAAAFEQAARDVRAMVARLVDRFHLDVGTR
jgi:hypothetical protein